MTQYNSNELEKLVAMAEDVSETVNGLQTKIANLRVMSMIATVGLYASVGAASYLLDRPNWLSGVSIAFYLLLILVAALIGLGSIFYVYQYVSKIKEYRRSLDAEIGILHRLLDMVHEYKDNIHGEELTYVERAILDMKLQRIKFSSKW